MSFNKISFGEMATMNLEELDALDNSLFEMTKDVRAMIGYKKRLADSVSKVGVCPSCSNQYSLASDGICKACHDNLKVE